MVTSRGFTLIELFIAIALVALVGSVVMVSAKPMLNHYRFAQSSEKLIRELALSKRIAQTASTYIEFCLEQKGDKLVCMRKSDEPLKLNKTLNTSIPIPFVRMEGKACKSILITSSGWIEKDNEITISLGDKRKTIDARNCID